MTTTAATKRLCVKDVAEQLGVHVQTARRYFRDGQIDGDRPTNGKYWTTQERVDAFLRGETPTPAIEPRPDRNPRYTR